MAILKDLCPCSFALSKPSRINFKDFVKAVVVFAVEKGFHCKYYPTSGSARRFDLFHKREDEVPFDMWVVHEDLRERKIYTQDLKKACDKLGVTVQDFEDLIKNKFKIK